LATNRSFVAGHMGRSLRALEDSLQTRDSGTNPLTREEFANSHWYSYSGCSLNLSLVLVSVIYHVSWSDSSFSPCTHPWKTWIILVRIWLSGACVRY